MYFNTYLDKLNEEKLKGDMNVFGNLLVVNPLKLNDRLYKFCLDLLHAVANKIFLFKYL